ncbi:MAG: hypothetical protein QM755_17015 [Luteolibacter sp.]
MEAGVSPHLHLSLDGKPGGKGGKSVPYKNLKITGVQLYDLDADPGEKNNLSAAHPEVVTRLAALADKQREEFGGWSYAAARHGPP